MNDKKNPFINKKGWIEKKNLLKLGRCPQFYARFHDAYEPDWNNKFKENF